MNHKYIKSKSIRHNRIRHKRIWGEKEIFNDYNRYEDEDELLLILCSKTYEWCINEHPIINSHIIYEERVILGKDFIKS